jgi:hypothetical protein
VLGNPFSYHQVWQNLAAVVARLEERKFFSLRDYLLMLIEDSRRGSAGAAETNAAGRWS